MATRFIDATIRLKDQISSGLANVNNKLEGHQKEVAKTGRQWEKTGKKMGSVGRSLTTKVTAPILAIGAAAVTMNGQFEDAMAKVGTIADTTKVPMKKLEDQVLSLSNKTGESFSDIAEAQYQAISAGVDTAASAKFVGVAVKAAKGGFTDTTTAVDGLTTVLNAYGLKAKDASKISDQMMITQNYGKTTFGELASSMGKVIPTASAMSVSTKELFSSMAVLTKNGIKTAEATTGLKAAYSNILKPSASAAEHAKKIGLNFSASHLKSVGWAKFLEEIKKKTGGNAESMGKLFGSTEALNSMLVLTGKGSKDFSTALGLMDKSAGATNKAYKKMLTPAEKNRIAINKLKNSAIKIGAAVAPVVTKIAGYVDKLADKISKMNDKQIDTVVKVAGIVAVAGPALGIIGKCVSAIGSVQKNLAKFCKIGKDAEKVVKAGEKASIASRIAKGKERLATLKLSAAVKGQQVKAFVASKAALVKDKAAMIAHGVASKAAAVGTGLVTAAQKALNFAFVSTPIGWVVLGIMAIVAAGIALYKNWDKATAFAGKLGKGIKKAFGGLGKFFSGLWDGIQAGFKAFINFIVGGLNKIPEGINKLQINIPKWVPKVGGETLGFNLPTIPYLAKGTSNWKGGLTHINERGGEIVDLPRGSRVYPHDKSVQMAKRQGSNNTVVNVYMNGTTIREEADIEKLGNAFGEEVAKRFGNRRTA